MNIEARTLEIIVKEYELLWDYYNKSMEERFRLFDWYFKIVALPASILIAILTLKEKAEQVIQVENYLPGVGCVFFVIYLCGVSLYITYVKQSFKAGEYHRSIIKIQLLFAESSPELKHVFGREILDITINESAKKNYDLPFDAIKFWRGATFVWFNSLLIASSFYLLLINYTEDSLCWIISGSIFLFSAFYHFLHYKNIFYQGSKLSMLLFLKNVWFKTGMSHKKYS